jgi:hypothetical protein
MLAARASMLKMQGKDPKILKQTVDKKEENETPIEDEDKFR